MFSTDIYHPSFIQNKYFDLYKRLIEADYSDEYMEKHHILPRCLGGTNDSSNLKPITSRIHFLAHCLLTKFVEKDTPSWHKVVFAFNMMQVSTRNTSRYFNSRLYEANRKHMSKTMSLLQSGSLNNSFGTMYITDGTINKRIKKDGVIPDGWFKGRTFNEETRKKISLASIGRTFNEETRKKISLASIGRTHSEETRKKMSLSKKKTMYITDGTENKRIKQYDVILDGWFRGKTHSEESRTKMRLASKNNMWITDGVVNKRINKDDVIADGWFKGRTIVLSEEAKSKMSLASKNSMLIKRLMQ